MTLRVSNFASEEDAAYWGGQEGAVERPYGYDIPTAPAPTFRQSTASNFERIPVDIAPPTTSFSPTPIMRPYSDATPKSRTRTPTSRGSATSYSSEPVGPPPEYSAGTFEAPEYDDREVSATQQALAAPGLRRLRRQINETQSQTYSNPNVKAMTLREALQGYGSGVESVLAGARTSAANEYGRKYKAEWDERMTNFRAAETAKSMNFQAALKAWESGGRGSGGSGSGGPTGGYNTPTGNIGYYTTSGVWQGGMPNVTTRRGIG